MAKYTHKNEFYTNQKPNRIEKFSYKKKNRMGKVALQSIKNRHTITMCGETEASRKEDSFFLGGWSRNQGGGTHVQPMVQESKKQHQPHQGNHTKSCARVKLQ